MRRRIRSLTPQLHIRVCKEKKIYSLVTAVNIFRGRRSLCSSLGIKRLMDFECRSCKTQLLKIIKDVVPLMVGRGSDKIYNHNITTYILYTYRLLVRQLSPYSIEDTCPRCRQLNEDK